MTTLVVGATGATGRLLVEQLLAREQNVKAIVRTACKLPEEVRNHDRLSLVEGSILDLTDTEIAQHVDGCSAVASCLGHNLTVKGMFGHPRRLVTEATRRLCTAVQSNPASGATKFVLMNTAGNSNRDINEPISLGQKAVMALLRLLLPPHVDNERAADYLRTEIGQNHEAVEWSVVRPDSLTNEQQVSEYELHASPIRSAIFNPGVTSRINVGHFMAGLITDASIWSKWKGKMPVIYNKP